MSDWARLLPTGRLGDPPREDRPLTPDRTPFQRDYDRIVFSSAFRRLHDKTQVFPLPDNDLVHSRLTHSLEVACVGRSLGAIVGQRVVERRELPEWLGARDFGDIVAAACLAHDIGNPPFGHSGEDAIASWFLGPGAALLGELPPTERLDLEQFEGNAQGFRIVTRLQMPSSPGLKLTFATLAAFTKYPREAMPKGRSALKKHGFHQAEALFFAEVAEAVGLAKKGPGEWQRHPLAFLVEAADDICYAILDLEDGLRVGHVPFALARELLDPIARPGKAFREHKPGEDEKEHVGYLRARAINQLIHEVARVFFDGEGEILAGTLSEGLTRRIPSYAPLKRIKDETRARCYEAREVLELELAGYEVLEQLLGRLVEATFSARPSAREKKLLQLLPHDPRAPGLTRYERLLVITDYLSGMTDGYAVGQFKRQRGVGL